MTAEGNAANDELREAIVRAIWDHMMEPYGDDVDITADAVLALPELAALRAKAAAVDRVRELADALEADSARLLAVEWRSNSGRQYADGIREGQVRAAEEIRRALDGDARTDRGRC